MRMTLFGWRINGYFHPRWKDVHGNRWWIEFQHPTRPRRLLGKIDNRWRP